MEEPNVSKLSKNFEIHGQQIIKSLNGGLDKKKQKIREKDPNSLTEGEKEILKCSEADYVKKLLANLQKKDLFKKIDEAMEIEHIKPILKDIKDSSNLN